MVSLPNPGGSPSGPVQKLADQLISHCKICNDPIFASMQRGWAKDSYLRSISSEIEVVAPGILAEEHTVERVQVLGLVHIPCAERHNVTIVGPTVTGGDVKRGKGTARAYGN